MKFGWQGVVLGMGMTLLMEGVWLSSAGIVVRLPESTIRQHVAAELHSVPPAQWGSVQGTLSREAQPLLAKAVSSIVDTVRIEVDGVTLGLTGKNQHILQRHLMDDFDQTLNTSLHRNLSPQAVGTLIDNAIVNGPKAMTVNVRVGFLRIPVTVRIVKTGP